MTHSSRVNDIATTVQYMHVLKPSYLIAWQGEWGSKNASMRDVIYGRFKSFTRDPIAFTIKATLIHNTNGELQLKS